ncbi:hypothetical protein O181_040288 [Austropuccinia psidii MF-1]|uniref:Protein kinase domain-containing protein n=1 Tax=Austropuccinia psidii MF-1 TaxID=1389203 RepID=A0A9Q3HCQ5_9BASI|nr:hypothetical protein [Austropuccinia psidii MF-1]
MASYYLKAAASYLDRSNISTSYTNLSNPAAVPPTSNQSNSSSVNPSSGPSNLPLAASNWSPPVRIGLWNVNRAIHNSTNKLVSVWTFEKKLDSSPLPLLSFSAIGGVTNGWVGGGSSSNTTSSSIANQQPKSPLEKVVDILKKEVSSLSRLRHPCILEVVEPLEETRTTMVFATEPITSCLTDAIDQSSSTRPSSHFSAHPNRNLELDEVETQKGLLQVAKGLQFLHESVKLVHCNLTPDAIIINAKGDWKISGFGLSSYLKQPDGQDSKWTFPSHDHRLPEQIQKNLDYIAPEYALDEHLSTSNDIYSLGCILHSIHTRNGPPFQNHNSLDNMRRNVENFVDLRAAWSRIPNDVQEVLSQLVTRTPSTRLSAAAFLNSRYFSSNLLVSTLAFLDRETFNSKQKEEQIQFMKGLVKILPQFSSKVVKQKILPSLLEETRKHILLPFLLPNIFYIAHQMDAEEFRSDLLPHITPLFSIKDPPQSILTLLDNLSIFQNKATPQLFREEVMPLIYVALESDVPALQEKALKVIPGLCETLEYTHVKQVLFPKVTVVFSKTTLLSVKVNTLICFHSMVNILDKYTLTEKLVPLLARIKTKEPAVMIATLAVHEEMGKKVELNAIATLILPQLWAMSIGPLLNIDQFNRFMNSIEQLSKRVKHEHTRHLLEAKRLEETTARTQPSLTQGKTQIDEAVDFENLVKGSQALPSMASSTASQDFGPISLSTGAWGLDDSFGVDNMNLSVNSLPSQGSKTHFPSPRLSNTRANFSQLSFPLTSGSSSSSMYNPTTSLATNTSLFGGSLVPAQPEPNTSQFIGLPPLKPQISSLNSLLSQPTIPNSTAPQNHHLNKVASHNQNKANSSISNWKVIEPIKTNSSSLTNTNNNQATLRDFDPFA